MSATVGMEAEANHFSQNFQRNGINIMVSPWPLLQCIVSFSALRSAINDQTPVLNLIELCISP